MVRSAATFYCWALIATALPSAFCQAVPSIAPHGVVSASGFGQFAAVAPGSWIEIYGANLATESRSWGDADFVDGNAPTSLNGTSVTIGGRSAFVDYISPGQINAQVPSNVATGLQQVVVTTRVGSSQSYSLSIKLTEPGLLAPAAFVVGSMQYAVAVFPDGVTFALPPGLIPGIASRRPRPGEIITLYGVGFGPVTPDIPAGKIVQQSNSVNEPLQMSIGGAPVTLTYQGLAPSAVGLYQFNAVVPSVASGEEIPLTFTLGGVAGAQQLYLAVDGLQVPQVTALTLSANSVIGGNPVTAVLALSSPAPAPGVTVILSSNNSIAIVPATVTVPAGSTSVSFSISTLVVGADETATITGTYNSGFARAFLNVARKPN